MITSWWMRRAYVRSQTSVFLSRQVGSSEQIRRSWTDSARLVADAYDSFGQATNMKGSVFWMAPEVIHSYSERSYSGKVDIWSLGCVVLEMWSGKRPWGDMEQFAAMFEVCPGQSFVSRAND